MLSNQQMHQLLVDLIELIEIPPSYYRLARDRYKSIGRFLDDSPRLSGFNPAVYPQGSFRYGTVIRPLLATEEYDLDLVCEIEATKAAYTQRQIKHLVGYEIKRYAEEKGFKSPAAEKKRCWRLDYADDVSFHMDILPAIPDDADFINILIGAGVEEQFARHAVAITDITSPTYTMISMDWPPSNPKGFAKWFESKMAFYALERQQRLVAERAYASVDEVPAYEWKTTLQRCIQLLKRHRDVMFQDNPSLKPISMIITALSARAYRGEANLWEALNTILTAMPSLVSPDEPRVPNPVYPREDFADSWREKPELETNFRLWCQKAKSDFDALRFDSESELEERLYEDLSIGYRVASGSLSAAFASGAAPQIKRPSKTVEIASPSRPWQA